MKMGADVGAGLCSARAAVPQPPNSRDTAGRAYPAPTKTSSSPLPYIWYTSLISPPNADNHVARPVIAALYNLYNHIINILSVPAKPLYIFTHLAFPTVVHFHPVRLSRGLHIFTHFPKNRASSPLLLPPPRLYIFTQSSRAELHILTHFNRPAPPNNTRNIV